MGRVKFKHARGGERAVRQTLLALLAPKVQLFRLIPARDGVIAITCSEADSDIIFSEEIEPRLTEAGFTPVMPPELRAQRTVVCFNLDELAYDNTPEEIRAELESHHSWLKIVGIYKFPNARTIKITCASSPMAKKAVEGGLLMFCLSVPPSQLKIEDHTPLQACDKCHAIEKHSTSQCPKPVDFKACSECGEEGHTFRECQSSIKKCINCTNNHSARAMRCPIRKAALRKKRVDLRKAQEARASTSYAAAAASSPITAPSTSSDSPPPRHLTTSLSCLLMAHLWNADSPGCFQDVYSRTLALNGIADVKSLPDPPSAGIIRAIAGGMIEKLAGQQSLTNPPPPAPREEVVVTAPTPTGSSPTEEEVADLDITNALSPTHTASSSEVSTDDLEGEVDITGVDKTDKEPGLEIRVYYKNSDPPPKQLTFESLKQGMNQKKLKLGHNLTASDTQTVLNYLRSSPKCIGESCTAIPDVMFDRMENGPFQKVPQNDPPDDAKRETRNGKKKTMPR